MIFIFYAIFFTAICHDASHTRILYAYAASACVRLLAAIIIDYNISDADAFTGADYLQLFTPRFADFTLLCVPITTIDILIRCATPPPDAFTDAATFSPMARYVTQACARYNRHAWQRIQMLP